MKVPLEVSASAMQSEIVWPEGSELESFRALILTAKTVVSGINFEEEVSRQIEEDYVRERKSKIDYAQDHLKLALTLTKYICVLDGTGRPEIQHYLQAKELIFEMVKRNNVRYPPKTA